MLPIQLTDYYLPLTSLILIKTFLVIGCWEIVGCTVNYKLVKSPEWTRLSWWLFGMGLFLFAWFVVNLFVPLTADNVLVVLVSLGVVCVPDYVKRRDWVSLVASIRRAGLVLLLLAPLLPALWVKSSLPPYLTDEMAYHFLSPFELAVATPWQFSGGIYQVIPRSLNLMFHATFALFRTYSPARLIHFSILLSAMLTTFMWLKRYFGTVRATLFVLLFFFLPRQNLMEAATSGYVDIGTASFSLLGILLTVSSILEKDIQLTKPALAFWSLSLGSKYSSLLAFVSAVILLGIRHIRNIQTVSRRFVFQVIIVFLLMGGFWYVKNLVKTGNPIYPFLGLCRGAECVGNSSFFGDWTTRIELRNIPSIANDILAGNRKLEYAFLGAIGLGLMSRNRLRTINLLLAIGILGEFVVMKALSGFLLRYFWHIQFITLLLLVAQTWVDDRDYRLVKLGKYSLLVFLTLFVGMSYYRYIRFMFAHDRLDRFELGYTRRQVDITGWVTRKFPQMSGVILWCNNQKSQTPTTLYRVDPDLIWFSYEGQMRTYMTNCHMTDLGIGASITEPTNVLSVVRAEHKLPFWYISLNDCRPENEIAYADYETAWQRYLRRANNQLVCDFSSEIPHLYRYNPK